MWKQSYFWFTQPSVNLLNYDYFFIGLFVAMFVLGVVLKISLKFMQHEVYAKLINKFSNLGLTMGLSGLIWAGLRYESTPIFANRYWAGLTLLLSLIWLIVILKYLIMNFGLEKREFEKQIINRRYIPSKK